MRIKPALRLECHTCNWAPPETAVMEAVKLHFQVEHDTAELVMDLAAICSCGQRMELVRSSPFAGKFVDHMLCLACGNTAKLERTDKGLEA